MRHGLGWALTAALVAAACGSAGGVTGSQETCTANGSSGTCTGRFATLSGTYDKIVPAQGCHTNVEVAVEVAASVESGTLHVTTTGPDGTEYIVEAAPGKPALLTGAAAGCQAEFHVIFAADRGQAAGVDYTIRYTVP
jgi:hypothetical protein